MVVLLVLVVVVDVGGEAIERLVFGSPLATPRLSNSLRAFIRNVDLFCRRAPATAKPTPDSTTDNYIGVWTPYVDCDPDIILVQAGGRAR